MITPKRTELTRAIGEALMSVLRLNGYHSNVGRHVVIGGERTANPGELPCCILTPGAEVKDGSGDPMGSAVVSYSITAFANRRLAEVAEDLLEWETIDAMLADIRTIMEGTGLCRDLVAARSITYLGADPLYSGADSEPCGVTVRYSIITSQD